MILVWNQDAGKYNGQEEMKMIVTTLEESARYHVLGENIKKALEWLKENDIREGKKGGAS